MAATRTNKCEQQGFWSPNADKNCRLTAPAQLVPPEGCVFANYGLALLAKSTPELPRANGLDLSVLARLFPLLAAIFFRKKPHDLLVSPNDGILPQASFLIQCVAHTFV